MIAELKLARPECIGIGNSMMFTRLGKTSEAISELTGRKFSFLFRGGSDPLVWHLILKNVVVPSGVRPRTILLFVRDDELTRPFSGNLEKSPYLRSLRGEREPDLDRFMGATRSGGEAGSRWDHRVEELYSFPGWRELTSRRLMDTAMDLGGLGATKKAQRFVLSARFSLDHLRGDVASDSPMAGNLKLNASGYHETIEASLLPGMVRMAKECGARLVVFRVKRRPDARTHLPEEPAAMRGYAAFLGDWLKGQGGGFFDETYDTSILLADYQDGDHIRPERLDWYRSYFWQRMEGVMP